MIDCIWRGLPAWCLHNAHHSAIISSLGAQVVSLALIGEETTKNPLWQPPWPMARPDDVALGSGDWGPPAEAPLLAGICGLNLCLPRFGAAYPGEDLPLHGEANLVPWQVQQAGCDDLTLSASFPRSRLQVIRRYIIDTTGLTITTSVSDHSGAARAIDWCEHVSLGGEMLDDGVVRAGVDGAWSFPADLGPADRFAAAGRAAAIPAQDLLNLPPADGPAVGDIGAARVAAGWWEITSARWGRRLRATWEANEFPWLTVWTEHRSRLGPPWRGMTRARGMEISTRPFPEGLPTAERRGQWQGQPTERWLPAGGTMQSRLHLAWGA
jgi:hypothetical protein